MESNVVDTSYILAPHTVHVRFELAPAMSAFESLRELTEVERLSGFGEWVTQTFDSLTQEQRDTHLLLCTLSEPLWFAQMPTVNRAEGFPEYLDVIAARDPLELRDQILAELLHYQKHFPEGWNPSGAVLTTEQLLNDEALFIRFMQAAGEKHGVPPELSYRGCTLMMQPERLQASLVEHLRWMWHSFLEAEWRRVEPLLYECVAAFERLDFSNLTAYEAIRAVTTRDLREQMDEKLPNIDSLVFIPTAHLGAYIVKVAIDSTLYVFFGARLPQGMGSASSALSRSELLTRLSALADDTRLRILELLTRHEELCAQDIIEMMELSQSSISRHLSQLVANGFVTERRRDVSKCYSLNTDRVMDTLRTLTSFMTRMTPPLPPAPPRPPVPLPPAPLAPAPPEPPGL